MRKIGLKWNIQLRRHQLKVLAGILCKAQSEEEMVSVLNTILTNSEKEAIAQRVSIMTKIKKGVKYFEIEGQFGVSPTTISKAIDIYLKHGDDNKNFNNVISRYKEPEFKYKSGIKHFEKNRSMFSVGTRAILREQKEFNERIAKNKQRNNNP